MLTFNLLTFLMWTGFEALKNLQWIIPTWIDMFQDHTKFNENLITIEPTANSICWLGYDFRIIGLDPVQFNLDSS